jgi:fibronectin-binding autotransporter adhesin
MLLLRRLHVLWFTRVIAVAALLLAALAQPGAAPLLAAPAATGPRAPHNSCGVVQNNSDHDTDSLRFDVGCVAPGSTVTFDPRMAGQTISLTSGEIAIGQSITIDGSNAPGLIVDAGNNSRVFNISAGGPVTLIALTLQRGSANNAAGGAVYDSSGSLLVLIGVNVLSSTVTFGTGGGVFANGPLVLTNSDFISNTSTSNGAGVVAGGAAVVTGGRFEHNTCTTSGCDGGALFGFAALTVSGTQFISNTSLSSGGALYASVAAGPDHMTSALFQGNQCTDSACQGGGLYSLNTLAMTDNQFISNTSQANGGAAYVNTNVTLTGGTFQGNRCTQADCQGGGLFANTTLSITDTQFISNTSVGHAGGAWVQGDAQVTGGRFERNACSEPGCQGGGLNVSGLTLSGTQFISNTSTDQGGGAWAYGPAGLTGARFQGNKCTSAASVGCQGGGLYSNDVLALTSTDFIGNSSLGNGGGAYGNTTTLLSGGSFQGNKCTSTASLCQGGGLFSTGVLVLIGTQFISNMSISNGGGAYALVNAALTGGSFTGNQCTGASCLGGGLSISGTLTLSGTQFINNASLGNGGGARLVGPATLTNGSFQGNQCTSAAGIGCQGGGLFALKALTLTNTAFTSNASVGGGGGAAVVAGAAVVSGGTFQGNQCTGALVGGCFGGGLYATAGLTLSGTQFINNTSIAAGGGAAAHGGLGPVTGDLSQTQQPSAGSGAPAAGPNHLTSALFQGNRCTGGGCRGGGLVATGATLVSGSSFSGNQSANVGGGLVITGGGQLTLANVTLSGNSASSSGGGLYAGGASQARLYNVTLADNTAPAGGGLGVSPAATVGVSNTIIANNTASNCAGPILFGTHNLEFPGAICAAVGPAAGFTTGDPQLAPLALNAPGTTLTQALGLDSPARDHGDPTVCAAPPVNNHDQRGVVRPIDGDLVPGAICDIGAYEAAPVWTLFLSLLSR